MMKNASFLLCFLCFGIFKVSGQNLQGFVSKFSQITPHTLGNIHGFQSTVCEPDSIHGYGFSTPTDSVLGQRQIFKKYGSTASATYTYEFTTSPLQLYSIDSTAFNGAGQPVFNELWEFDYDSNAVLIEERLFCYPHTGTVQTDYFFPADILNSIAPTAHYGVAFDSVILYRKSFFTGLMEPDEKTINVYYPSGQLQEEQIFSWDAFGSMSWFPSSKSNYFYTPSGRTEHVEVYDWNGIDFVLQSIAEYSYDVNDSLTTVISTNEITGLPEQKLDMVYDLAANVTSATFYGWDNVGQEWVESFYLLGDFDAQGRLELMEVVFNFFGSSDGIRFEFVYLDNSSCPWYSKIYEQESGGDWVFVGKNYYFPNFITSTYSPEALEWSAYPNPAKDGIWVKAPQGTFLQISTMQGVVLYRGFASGTKEYIDLKNAPHHLFLTARQGETIATRIIIVQD
jgi:hypothetical protein